MGIKILNLHRLASQKSLIYHGKANQLTAHGSSVRLEHVLSVLFHMIFAPSERGILHLISFRANLGNGDLNQNE